MRKYFKSWTTHSTHFVNRRCTYCFNGPSNRVDLKSTAHYTGAEQRACVPHTRKWVHGPNLFDCWTQAPSAWAVSDIQPGQVRSECLTCTFRASCCSARLSRAQVRTSPVPLSGTGTKGGGVNGGGGGGGGALHWPVQGSTSSPTGISNRRRVVWGVMEFGMSRRIKPKRNMRILM